MNDILMHTQLQQALKQVAAAPTHAILLTGPPGIGKTHIARKLGSLLLETNAEQLINNPYYYEITPIKQSISIEQVRQLTGYFRLKVPGKARIQRVAVIHDADTMGAEAQNALLKLLEEP